MNKLINNRSDAAAGTGSWISMLSTFFNLNNQQTKSTSSGVKIINSIKSRLDPDPQSNKYFPNHETRPVLQGHYVETTPEPLSKPFLLALSSTMVNDLGLDPLKISAQADLNDFVSVFSGNGYIDLTRRDEFYRPWATPYAVSVHGQPILDPDQFDGYAYGDGRAITLFHVQNSKRDKNNEFEVQLKGGGRTPFSRQFDGRAVLRSSIREFLVSELMHNLGVPTARSLCLVVSADPDQQVYRPWYDSNRPKNEPSKSTEEFFQYPPGKMRSERCAITTRVSSSFFRIGHLELYSRRMKSLENAKQTDDEEYVVAKRELIMLIKEIIRRHYPQLWSQMDLAEEVSAKANNQVNRVNSITEKLVAKPTSTNDQDKLLSPNDIVAFFRAFAETQASLVTNWLRVGFVEGNMNSDNILFNGCTLDYGPFGFIEKFDVTWNPFTSDPQKNYGFMNQPRAAQINLATLLDALMPLLEADQAAKTRAIDIVRNNFAEMFIKERNELRRKQLGLQVYKEECDELFKNLYSFLHHFDYILFWRSVCSPESESFFHFDSPNFDDDFALCKPLQRASYTEFLTEDSTDYEANVQTVGAWIRAWLKICKSQGLDHPQFDLMRSTTPKYIAREWMLVEAYEDAIKTVDNLSAIPNPESLKYQLGNQKPNDNSIAKLWNNEVTFTDESGNIAPIPFGKIYALQQLFSCPFDEHSKEVQHLFYQSTPKNARNKPGTAFYSCSS